MQVYHEKKECWIASVDVFRLGIEPRHLRYEHNTLTVELPKYPHDIASTRH